jgi:hypothetical protein
LRAWRSGVLRDEHGARTRPRRFVPECWPGRGCARSAPSPGTLAPHVVRRGRESAPGAESPPRAGTKRDEHVREPGRVRRCAPEMLDGEWTAAREVSPPPHLIPPRGEEPGGDGRRTLGKPGRTVGAWLSRGTRACCAGAWVAAERERSRGACSRPSWPARRRRPGPGVGIRARRPRERRREGADPRRSSPDKRSLNMIALRQAQGRRGRADRGRGPLAATPPSLTRAPGGAGLRAVPHSRRCGRGPRRSSRRRSPSSPFERPESPIPATWDWSPTGSSTTQKAARRARPRRQAQRQARRQRRLHARHSFGGALKCDGKGGYVEIPTQRGAGQVQDGATPLAAWFKPENAPPGSDSANRRELRDHREERLAPGALLHQREEVHDDPLAGGMRMPEEPSGRAPATWDVDVRAPALCIHVAGTDRPRGRESDDLT